MSNMCSNCGKKMCDNTGYSPLNNQIYCAVKACDYVLLTEILFMASIDEVNDKRLTNESALDLAAVQGDYLATKLLLEHGAEPDFNRPESTWDQSTLGRAIRSGNGKLIKLLIDKGGCNPDHTLKIDFTQQNYYRNSPYNCWYKVVELHKLTMFKFLLTRTKRQICNDEWSRRILLTACATGSTAIVTYLVDHGVPVDSVWKSSVTGAFYALLKHHIETFEFLVARGTNLKHTCPMGLSLLHLAASVGSNHEIIRQLLDRGIDVNLCDIQKSTPLHYAVTYSDTTIVELLLERGGDVNAVDKFGRTPIHTTIVNEFIDYNTKYNTFNLLFVQKNINLMQADVEGITVLHSLASDSQSYLEFRNVMLRPEVNINARDNNGETPFDYIIKKGYFFEFNTFFDFGADTKILKKYKDDLQNNRTAMEMLACQKLKRRIAGFEKDRNIESVLGNRKNILLLLRVVRKQYTRAYSSEIELMKATPLLGRITYFDFLHAKRRTCIAIASKPEMQNIFEKETHKFQHYSNMLCQKYVSGLRPLNEVEVEALNDAEDNINFLLNYRLPSLVVHQIKEYINIEDMVTLQSMNLFECNDCENVIKCKEAS